MMHISNQISKNCPILKHYDSNIKRDLSLQLLNDILLEAAVVQQSKLSNLESSNNFLRYRRYELLCSMRVNQFRKRGIQ